ncbi:MAG: DUF2085 domain-containing protein [Anaerolineales bacterium]
MRVTLYTKSNCGLCEQAKAILLSLQSEFPHKLIEVDIETEPRLMERFGESVPVVEVGPYTLSAPFDERDLRVTLASAAETDSNEAKPSMDKSQAVRLNRWVLSLSRHWLAGLNLLVLLYVGLPFLAPTLMKAGAEQPAGWIYRAYSPLCHQLAFRSWFLFGDQPAYPRALAGTSLEPFGQVSGISESDLYAARAFVGNPEMGYKVALCERDVAIYGGIFLAGLAFALVRGRLKPLPIALWVVFGIGPIALDGFSQLFSGIPIVPFTWLPLRESTPFLRTLTGGLFGVMNVWMAYPYVEETMAETRALVSAKLKAADVPQSSLE